MFAETSTFWNVNVGSLLIAGGLVANAFSSYIRKDAKLEGILAWKSEHMEDSKKRDEMLNELKELASSSRATADGQERRLRMLEDRRNQYQG